MTDQKVWPVILMVVLILAGVAALLVTVQGKVNSDETDCRARGGIPVTHRTVVTCFAPGTLR